MKLKIDIPKIGIVVLLILAVACDKLEIPNKDASRVEALIAQAQTAMNGAEQGPEPGLYPVGSVDLLQTYIDSAQTQVQNAKTQFGIDKAEFLLKDALDQFVNSVQMEQQIYLDGTAYLDGGAATPFLTPNITLSAWVRPTDEKNAMYIISTEGAKTGYKLQMPNLTPKFSIGVDGKSVKSLSASTAINLNEWTHITASFDGNKMRLYINGVMDAEMDLTYQMTDNGENFRIGEGSKFTGRTMIGRVKDVRVWDHALTDAEVTASLTTKPTGTEQGLIAWWPFNLSAGNVILDRTGNHSVTLINVQYVDPI